jgi:hypothetical protein
MNEIQLYGIREIILTGEKRSIWRNNLVIFLPIGSPKILHRLVGDEIRVT